MFASFEGQCYGKSLFINKAVEDSETGEKLAVTSLFKIKPEFVRNYRQKPIEKVHTSDQRNSKISLSLQIISLRLYRGRSKHPLKAPHSP